MEVIKFVDGINYGCAIVDTLTSQMRREGFYEVIDMEQPRLTEEESRINTLSPSYDIQGGKAFRNWTLALDVDKIKQQIAIVKQQLADTDYVFIKRAEYEKTGKNSKHEDEYYLSLSNQRDKWRDDVNYLLSLLGEQQSSL